MSNKRLRTVLRYVHLVGAALIGTFVYAPWRSEAWFVLSMQVVIIPVLTLSGLALWQQARVGRLLGAGRRPRDPGTL